MNSFNFYVNTRDGLKRDNLSSDVYFLHALGPQLSNQHYSISLEQAIIPNLEFPINSKTDTFTFEEFNSGSGTNTFTVSLTHANYTGTTLAVEVQAQMNAVANNTYTVTYDSAQGRLDVSTSGLPDIVRITTDNETLGFKAQPSLAFQYIGTNPIRLDGTSFYEIWSSLHTGNITSDGRQSIISRIANPVNYGGVVFWENPNDSDNTFITSGNLQNLEIRILDDRGMLVELPENANISLTFRLTQIS